MARLQHPNIVQIHEIGEHNGLPFLCLEYADGGSLARHLAGIPQPARDAAALVETLARAVEHAHRAGVIHRDLKPANVLLSFRREPLTFPETTSSALAAAARDSGGIPKITDFGLAKCLDGGASLNATGTVAGTPGYMAPEQILVHKAVGPAADVYALGGILYELLTGRPPFVGANTLAVLRQVVECDPVPPSRLLPGVPHDLETLCLHCLNKEPGRRYPSAAALADDLRRYLVGEPVVARPVGPISRAGKWARRHPAVAVLLAAVVLVTGLALGLVLWQWSRAEAKADDEIRARQDAQEKERQAKDARREVERLSAGILFDQGVDFCENGDIARGLVALVQALEMAERCGDQNLARVARVGLATWPQQFIRPRGQVRHRDIVLAVGYSGDGKTAATGCRDGKARLLDVATGRARGAPLAHDHGVFAVALSPDGQTLLTGGGTEDGRVGEARLWDTASAALLARLPAPPGMVYTVAFSKDGTRFLTACQAQVQLWEARTRTPLGAPLRHPGDALDAALFSPDGQRVLTVGRAGLVRLWLAATGAPDGEPLPCPPVKTAAWSGDGSLILTGSMDGTAQVWDTSTRCRKGPALKHRGPVNGVAFSRDGKTLATATVLITLDMQTNDWKGDTGEVRLWGVDGTSLGHSLPHPREVVALAFSPDGKTLLTGCKDSHARFFRTATGELLGRPLWHEGVVSALAFSPTGETALTGGGWGGSRAWAARLWEVPAARDFRSALSITGIRSSLAFSADGHWLLIGTRDAGAQLWAVANSQPVGARLEHPSVVQTVAISPDSKILLTAGLDRVVRIWDRATCSLLHECKVGGDPLAVVFRPNGRTFLTGDEHGRVCVWDTGTGKKLATPIPAGKEFLLQNFDADGRTLVRFGEQADRVELWDLGVGLEAQGPPRSYPAVNPRLSPDGKTTLTVTERDCLQVRNAGTGQPVGAPLGYAKALHTLHWSPDGRTVAAGTENKIVRLWDVAARKPLGAPLGHPSLPELLVFTANSRLLAVSHDRVVYLWPMPSPLAGDVPRLRLWVEVLTGLAVDAPGEMQKLDEEALAERRQRLEQLGGPPTNGWDRPG